jgi:Histidinol phosphatase and related phosphatases
MTNVLEKENIKSEDVLYCPHHPNGIVPEYSRHCTCRKPNTSLIDKVIGEHKYQVDELAQPGDKKSDIDAGIKLGIDTYLVLTGYGKEHCSTANATSVMPDILSVAKHIVNDL